MKAQSIPTCCKKESKYKIEYLTGQTFLVCTSCIKILFWSRHQKKKTIIRGKLE